MAKPADNTVESFPARIWQWLTFRGLAQWAVECPGLLVRVALLTALASAVVWIWFLLTAWLPPLQASLAALPNEGAIQAGRLQWPTNGPTWLAENQFLAVGVQRDSGSGPESLADLVCLFRSNHVRLKSLLGYVALPYPPQGRLPLNRLELEPSWGAWRPVGVVTSAVLVVLTSLIVWSLIALVYGGCLRVLIYYGDRLLSRWGCWTLALGALMPGAWLANGLVVAYGLGQLGLTGLLASLCLPILLTWIYLIGAYLFLPRLRSLSSSRGNPFAD